MALNSNDQFTNWYDHEDPEIHDMSRFDLAAMAWKEAWNRAKKESERKTFEEWNRKGFFINKGSKGKVVFTKDQVTKKKTRGYHDEDYENDEDDPLVDCEIF